MSELNDSDEPPPPSHPSDSSRSYAQPLSLGCAGLRLLQQQSLY